ncbi:MAG: NAD-dependent epimerase/dehydratase family protein [Pseudobdellovibrio sp.]
MKLNSNYAPNILRLAYDLVVCAYVAITLFVFGHFTDYGTHPEILFVAPMVAIAYFLLSLTLKVKTPKFSLQTSLIFILTGLAYIVLYAMSYPQILAAAFSLFTFPLLVIPRYFLNLKKYANPLVYQLGLKNKGSVLVVGGAGYIGSHLVDILLKKNYSVRVLDNLAYGKESLTTFFENPRFEFINGDVTDISKLVAAVSDCSTVVHLGGLVGDPACAVDKDFTRHENIISTRMLKEAAKSAGVSRFVFASSCSVYGSNDNIVDETSELNPVSLYASTKIDSEKELQQSINDDFSITILRFATVFGHSFRPRFDLVVNLFTAQAFVDQKVTVMGSAQWRPFVHCRDIARAIEKVVSSPKDVVRGQVFNVGDDRLNTTIGELGSTVAKVAKELNITTEVTTNDSSPDRRNYKVSFAKIKRVLGFECEYTIESGIREMFTHFQKGTYKNYKDKTYSNLETTKNQVNLFYDPMHTNTIYKPVSETLMPKSGEA